MNATFETTGSPKSQARAERAKYEVGLKTMYKESKAMNTSLDAPKIGHRIAKVLNPLIAKLPPALRRSILNRKKY